MSTAKRKSSKNKLVNSTTLVILTVILIIGAIILDLPSKLFGGKVKSVATDRNLYGIAAGNALQRLTTDQFATQLLGYKTVGAEWVRFDFDWANIQSGGQTSYNWTKYDAAITQANVLGIKVLGIISYTPTWQLPVGCTNNYFCPPKDVSEYAAFAATLATRYAPMGVHHWEIWNEPNLGSRFTLTGYADLLKAAYPAIKNVDPQAFVLTGGTGPAATNASSFSPTDFLTGIYQNGGQGYFDAVAHHPYCYAGTFNCPTTFVSWSAWSQMQDTNPSLRSIMTTNGDTDKKIWATEFGAPTSGGTQAVTEEKQAQMITDAYQLFDSYSWSGPLFWYTYQDRCTTTTDMECYFGMVRFDGTNKPSYDVYQNAAVLPTPTPTPVPTPTPTPTPVPTAIPTPVPTPAAFSTQVTSLTETGTSSKSNAKFDFTLQTTGSKKVDRLIIAIRDRFNRNRDITVKTNYTLTETQIFTASKKFSASNYTYWIAYYANGKWTNLSPVKTFQIK